MAIEEDTISGAWGYRKKQKVTSHFFYSKELRAVRVAYAGQSRLGDISSILFNEIKEVIVMIKKLRNKAGVINDSTLGGVIFGWLTFLISFFIPNLVGVIILQSVARVLP